MTSESQAELREVRIPDTLPEDPNASFNPGKTMDVMWSWADTKKASSNETLDLSKSVRLNAWLLDDTSAADQRHEAGDRPGTRERAEQEESEMSEAADPRRHRGRDTRESNTELPLPAPSPYRLRRAVGEGGFGQVWEAVQQSLGRVIAVKKLKGEVISRRQHDSRAFRYLERSFRQEALTTGSLEHPNIVPVYDLGLDERGMPMLAMKLVRGRPWDEVIYDDRFLPMPEFLARHLPVLIAVAQAVAFAHSRGVVHRDIKPTQAMLGEFGEVLLMDWGLALVYDVEVAAATAPQLAHSEFTTWSTTATSPAGTPSYMAPEQTEDTAIHVGPWTDIFLLGGTLYFLLTGTPPNLAVDSKAAFARAVHAEISPPQQRAPDRDIPPELAALCMGALRRDPKDRLATAKDFIAGLQDYLTGSGKRRESLALAREAEALAEGSKTADDYAQLSECVEMVDRALFLWPTNTEAVQLRQTLLMNYARAALQSRDLKLARVQAERLDPGPVRGSLLREIMELEAEQRRAEARINDAYDDVRKERDLAEKAKYQAEDLVNYMLSNLYRALQPLNRIDLLDQVARKALEYFEANPARDQDDATLHRRSQTFYNIGEVLRAKGLMEEALKAYGDSRAMIEILFRRQPENDEWRFELSNHHEKIASVNFEQGLLENCMRSNRIATDIRQRLVARHPGNVKYQNALATCHQIEGTALWRCGRQHDSIRAFETSIAIREHLLDHHPGESQIKIDLATALNGMCWTLRAMGDSARGLETVSWALALRKELAERDPENTDRQAEFAWCFKSQALLLEDRGDHRGALAALRSALAINQKLADNDPSNMTLTSELAFPLGAIGRNLAALGDLAGSRDQFEKAIAIQNRLLSYGMNHTRLRRDYVFNLIEYSATLLALGETGDATRHALQGLSFAEKLMVEAPENPAFVEIVARALRALGLAQREQGHLDRSYVYWNRAVELLTPAMRVGDHPGYMIDTLAKCLMHLGRPDDARVWIERLRAKNWREREFVALCRECGLWREDA